MFKTIAIIIAVLIAGILAFAATKPDIFRVQRAMYAWDGNKDIGQGSMEITESTAPSRVALKLDFTKPFEAHNVVDFTLEPKGESTIVTWDMRGPAPYMAKIVHVFLDMDSMVGKDFEAGLANLKALAEKN